jgi:hypothetical protein
MQESWTSRKSGTFELERSALDSADEATSRFVSIGVLDAGIRLVKLQILSKHERRDAERKI